MNIKAHIPNFLTCCNLISGVIGILECLAGREELAIYYVLLSGAFDFLDGFMARILHVQSPIGKELDSLADVISFGLLPSVFLMVRLQAITDQEWIPYSALLVVVFSALRLAKFNIDTRQSDQFLGLPVPANAIGITSLIYLSSSNYLLFLLLVIIPLSCFLLVSELPLMAFKFNGFGWKSNQNKYLFLIGCVVLLIPLHLAALPYLIPLYMFTSVIGNFLVKDTVSSE